MRAHAVTLSLAGLLSLSACLMHDPPPDPAPPDPAAPDALSAPAAPSTFTYAGARPAECPESPLWCARYWPPAAQGEVTLHTSVEAFAPTGATHPRTFRVYRPARATGPVPVVIALHGGNGSGVELLATLEELVQLSDGRGLVPGVTWERGTAACRYERTGVGAGRFRTPLGLACTPETARVRNAQPFVLVFPDGVLDPDSPTRRHWEDGRTPSPGWLTTEEQRDDLGFLDHVIATLVGTQPGLVDPQRIYLLGASNGGMMTIRAMCSAGDPRYPALGRVAAFAPMIATMPETLARGLAGRPACSAPGARPLAAAFFVGDAVPTPDCTPFPCMSPTVDGDGFMPYGDPGGTHTVWSPEGGRVVSFPDQLAHWTTLFGAAFGAPELAQRDLGLFTGVRDHRWGDQARLEIWDTLGGHHLDLSSRMEFLAEARAWEFLSRHARDDAGRPSRTESTPLLGDY